jgi:hypothetical protein
MNEIMNKMVLTILLMYVIRIVGSAINIDHLPALSWHRAQPAVRV